ncbi:unnamed protein product [Closterium sp. NIES-65]|nr:unnamed protein product [Closterium sp. NIES-65]
MTDCSLSRPHAFSLLAHVHHAFSLLAHVRHAFSLLAHVRHAFSLLAHVRHAFSLLAHVRHTFLSCLLPAACCLLPLDSCLHSTLLCAPFAPPLSPPPFSPPNQLPQGYGRTNLLFSPASDGLVPFAMTDCSLARPHAFSLLAHVRQAFLSCLLPHPSLDLPLPAFDWLPSLEYDQGSAQARVQEQPPGQDQSSGLEREGTHEPLQGEGRISGLDGASASDAAQEGSAEASSGSTQNSAQEGSAEVQEVMQERDEISTFEMSQKSSEAAQEGLAETQAVLQDEGRTSGVDEDASGSDAAQEGSAEAQEVMQDRAEVSTAGAPGTGVDVTSAAVTSAAVTSAAVASETVSTVAIASASAMSVDVTDAAAVTSVAATGVGVADTAVSAAATAEPITEEQQESRKVSDSQQAREQAVEPIVASQPFLRPIQRSRSSCHSAALYQELLGPHLEYLVWVVRGKLLPKPRMDLYPDAPHAYLLTKRLVTNPALADTQAGEETAGGSGDSDRDADGSGAAVGMSISTGKKALSARESLMSEVSDALRDVEDGDLGEALVSGVFPSGRGCVF